MTRTNTAEERWVATIRDGLNREDRTAQLASLLGSPAAVERFKTVALHAVVHDTKLRDADPLSVIEAVREAATLGLEPTGVLGEAWILPYGRTARLSVGYRGYLKLIRQSGAVGFVDAQIVYLNDAFHVQFGTDPRIDHTPLLFGERDAEGILTADRGSYRGAYAWAELDGTARPLIEWMPLSDIEQARKASPSVKAGRATPWDNWYGEMARKTAVRRLAKRLPLDPRAQSVVAYEDQTDRIEREAFDDSRPSTVLPAKAAALAALDARRGVEIAEEPSSTAEDETRPTSTAEDGPDTSRTSLGGGGTSSASLDVGRAAEDVEDPSSAIEDGYGLTDAELDRLTRAEDGPRPPTTARDDPEPATDEETGTLGLGQE